MGQLGHTATPADRDSPDALSLVFRAGSLLCALRLGDVIEIMRPLATSPLAGAPGFVRGVSILRGVPTPVVDVARLLGGETAEINRYVAVRTERGPVAFATGPVLGIRATATDGTATRSTTLLGDAAATLVTGVATLDDEPLLLLQSMRVLPDQVWAAAAREAVPP